MYLFFGCAGSWLLLRLFSSCSKRALLSLWCMGFSLQWLLFSLCSARALGSMDFSTWGSWALEHKLSSCSAAGRIFPDQGSRWILSHWATREALDRWVFFPEMFSGSCTLPSAQGTQFSAWQLSSGTCYVKAALGANLLALAQACPSRGRGREEPLGAAEPAHSGWNSSWNRTGVPPSGSQRDFQNAAVGRGHLESCGGFSAALLPRVRGGGDSRGSIGILLSQGGEGLGFPTHRLTGHRACVPCVCDDKVWHLGSKTKMAYSSWQKL